jgi:hypothetical protein
MNNPPLTSNQQGDTIGDTVTDHRELLTSALVEHSVHEALISSLQHQFERHINVPSSHGWTRPYATEFGTLSGSCTYTLPPKSVHL